MKQMQAIKPIYEEDLLDGIEKDNPYREDLDAVLRYLHGETVPNLKVHIGTKDMQKSRSSKSSSTPTLDHQ